MISVCLIQTPCYIVSDDRLESPLGLLYLGAVVKRHGYKVQIVDLSSVPQANLRDQIPNGFDAYGFSTYTVTYNHTLTIAKQIKETNPQATFIAGGPHATALPERVLADGFDLVVRGEGEHSILSIMRSIEQGTPLRGILIGEKEMDLDELPFPDYSLVDLSSYSRVIDGHKSISVLTSRGCPYRCAFCNSIILGAGQHVRYRSPSNIIDEIKAIKSTWGIDHLRFQDDLFTCSMNRIKELAPSLAEEGINYRCFARIDTFSYQMAEQLKRSGCIHVSFGVESGSEKLLSPDAMNKGHSPHQIKEALEICAKFKIRSRIYLMIGFPGETDVTIAETISLLKKCSWDEFSVYPFIPYPGTPPFENPGKFGITYINNNFSNYIQIGRNKVAGYIIKTAGFDETKVFEWRNRMIKELCENGRMWAGNSKNFC